MLRGRPCGASLPKSYGWASVPGSPYLYLYLDRIKAQSRDVGNSHGRVHVTEEFDVDLVEELPVDFLCGPNVDLDDIVSTKSYALEQVRYVLERVDDLMIEVFRDVSVKVSTDLA